MPTADELWARVQAAEKQHQAALGQCGAFAVRDPTSEGSPEYEDAYRAASVAWVDAEMARHELDAFLNPRRYAEKGHEPEALDQFRAQAGTEAEPEAEPGA